jgi:hypothetical protein
LSRQAWSNWWSFSGETLAKTSAEGWPSGPRTRASKATISRVAASTMGWKAKLKSKSMLPPAVDSSLNTSAGPQSVSLPAGAGSRITPTGLPNLFMVRVCCNVALPPSADRAFVAHEPAISGKRRPHSGLPGFSIRVHRGGLHSHRIKSTIPLVFFDQFRVARAIVCALDAADLTRGPPGNRGQPAQRAARTTKIPAAKPGMDIRGSIISL